MKIQIDGSLFYTKDDNRRLEEIIYIANSNLLDEKTLNSIQFEFGNIRHIWADKIIDCGASTRTEYNILGFKFNRRILRVFVNVNNNIQYPYQISEVNVVNNLKELLIWLLTHELFHISLELNGIYERSESVEYTCDEYADIILEGYRNVQE